MGCAMNAPLSRIALDNDTPMRLGRRRRQVAVPQAAIARAGRAAEALGPQWFVEVEGDVVRLRQGEPAQMPTPNNEFARGLGSRPIMDSMPRPLPPFLHREITRHGRPVWYFRRGKGRRIRIPGEFGSVEFNCGL